MQDYREQLKVMQERAVLVGAVMRQKNSGCIKNDELAELESLAQSAGAVVVDRFVQKIKVVNAATYIGKGKAEMLAERVERFEANVVIFDNDLSPNQIRELEKIVKTKIIDRSELILDIFATRAQTHQAKLQVELAQLQYTYPRLTRMWGHLDTVAGAAGGAGAAGAVGGIGTRGTGEKQLEIDRRLVNKRITELKRDLEVIDRRKLREISGRHGQFKVSLVGYTNAGKSTLMNMMTGADVYVQDQLFATLDTRTKKWIVERGAEVLLSDTVGFVRKLPHHLVASFKATLEEAVNADLLLHVVDVSNEEAFDQIESVDKVLKEIGCGDKEVLMLLNKADCLASKSVLEELEALYPDSICISAKTGMNIEALSQAVLDRFRGRNIKVRVTSCMSNGKVQAFMRANTEVLDEKYENNDVIIDAIIGHNHMPLLKKLRPDNIEIAT